MEISKKRQFHSYKFLLQKQFVHNHSYFYIANFYCAELSLIIELDGKIHDFQKKYDYQQDFVLNRLGMNVPRIRNEELVNMDNVFEKILKFVP